MNRSSSLFVRNYHKQVVQPSFQELCVRSLYSRYLPNIQHRYLSTLTKTHKILITDPRYLLDNSIPEWLFSSSTKINSTDNKTHVIKTSVTEQLYQNLDKAKEILEETDQVCCFIIFLQNMK